MTSFLVVLRRWRSAIVAGFDVAAWVSSFVVFTWLRYDGVADQVPWVAMWVVAAAVAGAYLLAAWASGLLRGRAAMASLEEMVLLGATILGLGVVVTGINLIFQWLPRSVPPGAAIGTLVLTAWARATWRRLKERSDEASSRDGSMRVVVAGAGDAGRDLISSMLRDPQRQWRPVALVDDDPAKRRLRIRSVPVMGSTEDIGRLAPLLDAQVLVIAIPSADSRTIARLRAAADQAGLSVKVLPATAQLFDDRVGIRDIRDINITDVLGRNQLDTDIDSIAGYLTGRRVLVTGAGGSIGSELCRQIFRFAPAELMMLDRDESALHAVELSLHGRALLDSDEVILCDIRDREALRGIFESRRPEVVFHAAALKHLPMLEQYPAEAIKTNVDGTRIVLAAAAAVDVETFVNISTDKAANPTSVLGYSKRLAEALTASCDRTASGSFVSVRFGNVLGSRGSVLTAFAQQIAAGGPVTVTDPEVTRYFMTIEEACQLVIQAAAIGTGGEVMVLDMGEPVRILDVAHQLMNQAEKDVRIEYTGLREGEKLHEELFGDGEPHDVRPRHHLVSHVPVAVLDDVELPHLVRRGTSRDVRDSIARACAALAEAPAGGPRSLATVRADRRSR